MSAEPNYQKVRIAFALMYFSLVVSLAFSALLLVSGIVISWLELDFVDPLFLVTSVVLSVVSLAFYVGLVLCLFSPEQISKRWAIATNVLLLLDVAFTVWTTWLSEYAPIVFRDLPITAGAIHGVLGCLSIFCFLSFAKVIAKSIKSKPFYLSVTDCFRIYLLWTIGFVLTMVLVVVADTANENSFWLINVLKPNLKFIGVLLAIFSLFAIVKTTLMLKTGTNSLSAGSLNE